MKFRSMLTVVALLAATPAFGQALSDAERT